MTSPKVILRRCPDYDPDQIRGIVREGLQELGLRPSGRCLVKPNVVTAGTYFRHAYTRPEFTEGVLRALRQEAAPELRELALGERCGITLPTRYALSQAGYPEMLRRVGGVPVHHFEESPQILTPLRHSDRLRDAIYMPEPVLQADFFVNCPKFKAHPWTTVTFGCKNYIGLQDDAHRLVDHHFKLDEKVADLQEILQPQFLAVDGIIAGSGRMLTPTPFELGLIIMGNQQLALDAVCCQILGLDPMEVGHLRLVHGRGYGELELDQIALSGDLSLEEARAQAQGFQLGRVRVDEYFQQGRVRAYAGPPPSETEDYCWGGCPGALQEAVEFLRVYDARSDERLPRMHVIFGRYEGPLEAEDDEPILFLGDCASFEGFVQGRSLSVESVFQSREGADLSTLGAEDIFKKILKISWKMLRRRKGEIIHLRGCPVSVAEQVLTLVSLGKLQNPYLDPRETLPFISCYLSWRSRQALQRLSGQGYLGVLEGERGEAQTRLRLPPPPD